MAVQTGPDKFSILQDTCKKIWETIIKSDSFESGGIVGVNDKNVICEFVPDDITKPEKYEYNPNVDFLNDAINKLWLPQGIRFSGFVHSHPHNSIISSKDIEYSKEILSSNPHMRCILSGIVNLSDRHSKIKWYLITSEITEETEIRIV